MCTDNKSQRIGDVEKVAISNLFVKKIIFNIFVNSEIFTKSD